MAMNAATLGAAMASALGVTEATAMASFVTLAGTIITHITAHAVVSVTTSTNVTTPQLATVLSAAPGSPVTGTITGAAGTGTGTIA